MTDKSLQNIAQPPARILIAKAGLDGHDLGAKYVTHVLRDAGYEVLYTGIRRTPEEIVRTAIEEDVAVIGLSLLSGSHLVLFKRVLDLLKEQRVRDILVIGGGTIPAKDVATLKGLGVIEVFTSGTSATTIVETLRNVLQQSLVHERQKATA